MLKNVPKITMTASLVLFASVFAIASAVWADVSLTLPENVYVVALNGENSRIENEAILPNGVSQIVVRYEGMLYAEQNSSLPDEVKSAAYVIKIEASDAILRLVMPRFRDSYDVKLFDKKPDIRVLTAEGTLVDINYERLDTEGFVIFRDFERELEKFNKTDSPVAVPPLRNDSWQARTTGRASGGVTMVAPEMSSAQQAEATSMSVQMLKFWWKQADEASRQQFRDWIGR